MSNPAFPQFLRRWASKAGRPKASAKAARPAKLRLEEVENRLVPVTAPTPLTGAASTIVNGPVGQLAFVQPSAAADPTNPNNMVMVTNNGTYMIAYSSTDGGATWSPFFDNNQFDLAPPVIPNAPPPPIAGGANGVRAFRLQDPGIDPLNRPFRSQRNYTNTVGASAAFARDGSIYITAVEQNAPSTAVATSGAVVLYAFDFNGGTPRVRDLDPGNVNDSFWGFTQGGYFDSRANVLYRWLNTGGAERDGAFNPTVAVDNNLSSFTDPETGQTVVDTLAGKAVYVAWNNVTNLAGTNNGATTQIFSGSAIQVAASSNGGRQFSTPVLANSGAYYSQNNAAVLPAISFTPLSLNPDTNPNTPAANTAGQITFSWQTTGGRDTANNPVRGRTVIDTSRPDDDPSTPADVGSAARPAVAAFKRRVDLNAGIADAGPSPGAGFPDVAAITNVTFDVDLTDPAFGNLGPNDPVTDLNFGTAIFTQDPSTFLVQLISPDPDPTRTGTGFDPVTITLFRNWTDGFGQTPPAGTPPFGVLPGNNFGIGIRTFAPPPNFRGNVVATVFDDEAPRWINDRGNVDPFIYNVKPDSLGGGLLSRLYTNPLTGRSRTASELSGTWTVRITDVRDSGNPPTTPNILVHAELHASGYISNTGFGTDRTVTAGASSPAIVTPEGIGLDKPAVSPVIGLAGGPTIAYDASLGSYSPFAGRLYMAITNPVYDTSTPPVLIDSNILVVHSDDGGVNWSTPVRVNDDNRNDNFSEGRRWQFAPQIAVDSATGTVVVTWYDARNDASDARVATYIATSIDGGQTFSARLEGGGFSNQTPSTQTFLNNPKMATDSVTGQDVVLEPIPSNFSAFNLDANGANGTPQGYGFRQSLLAYDGKVYPFWAGNNNAPGSGILIGRNVIADGDDAGADSPVRVTAGPRIIAGDMGPVIASASAPAPVGGYNNTFAADGTRLLDGFVVQFDRRVAVETFTPADVEVRYRGPATPLSSGGPNSFPVLGTLIPVSAIIPLDAVTRNAGSFTDPGLATRFFVRFANPQGAIGTYSYAVGPNIRDRIRTVQYDQNGNIVPPTDLGNEMDQDGDGFRNESLTGENATDDRFAAPRSTTGEAFTLPYATDTLPLVIPGPYIVGTAADRPAGQPDTADNLVLNSGTSGLTVTFDRDIVPATFVPGNIRRMTGPAGDIPGPFTVVPVAVNPVTGGARSFRIGFPSQVLSGGYTFELGPNPVDPNPSTNTIRAVDQPRALVQLPAGATQITITVGSPVTRALTPADVRVLGPNGQVTPAAVSATGTTVQVTIPAGPAGQYVVELPEDIRVPAIPTGTTTPANRNPLPLIDTNQNAGVELLRGGVPEAGEVLATSTYNATGPVAIPAGGTAELGVDIRDDFLVRQDTTNDNTSLRRSIQLTLNVQFPNVPDLQGVLVSPDGTEVVLFNSPGTQGQPNQNDFAGTVFDDQGTTPISAARPPFSPAASVYNPQEPFGRFVNRPQGPVSAKGRWVVRITNTGTRTGTIQSFALTLPFAVPGTGLGEPGADRASVGFRIFTQDPSNPLARQQWTPVGPASQNAPYNDAGFNTGRVSGLAVDPSDPSGNTVYAGGASGGIWKTTNFLTTSAGGPDWVPLTDLGPTNSLNIGSIAVFGRNSDTNQSVILAATGEGDILGRPVQGGGTATVSSPGVGFLLSVDGGKTWRLLDSTNNVDASGNVLPISSQDRNRRFVGTVGFKVLIDPAPTPNGELIFYAALSNGTGAGSTGGGIWRSNNTGKTWTLVRAGEATDVALAAGSAPSFFDPTDPNLSDNLQVMFAAFRGEGVFFSPQAPDATSTGGPGALTQIDGRGQNPLFRDDQIIPSRQIPIATFNGQANRTPGGNKGRITLAVPALSTDVVRNVNYQGWVYALVSGSNGATDATGGPIDGLYMSKDFGRNWTRVRINVFRPQGTILAFGTNDVSAPEWDPLGLQGNYAQSIAVDPRNPNIVYLGGSNESTLHPLGGMLRIDVTQLEDAQNVTAYNNRLPNTLPDGGTAGGPRLQFGSPPVAGDPSRATGSVIIYPYQTVPFPGPGQPYGISSPDDLRNRRPEPDAVPDPLRVRGYLNVFRNPADPFTSNSTIGFLNVDSRAGGGFQNRGFGAFVSHIDAQLETNVHDIITFVDPLTGKTRIITADDQGVASVVANDDGSTDDDSIGFAAAPDKRRNGDLQLGQFYYGASQPSQLAADIAGVQRLFYGTTDANGYPRSTNTVLQDGGIRNNTFVDVPLPYTFGERSVGYSGTGVATDQTGSGTAYEFRWPGFGGNGTDFFRVIPRDTYQDPAGLSDGFSRTNGLLQDRSAIGGVADDPLGGNTGVPQGQWIASAGSNFAVNPINRNGIIISANGNNQGVGRLFRTTNQGVNWFVIGETPQVANGGVVHAPGTFGPSLDGTYSAALAFGAPRLGATQTELDNFIYAGTNGGRVFVTQTGNGPWLNIAAPLGSNLGGSGALDGSAVQQIVANPRRGTTDLFAVTLRGVYYKANAFDTSTGWVNITGNLFNLQKATLPNPANPADNTPTLKYLTTIAADWRFATPVDPSNPQSPTFPVLYVGGEGGVFRSVDFGATWNYFPAASQYTDLNTGVSYNIPDGGYLPNVHVTDLDLVLGNINPATGLPDQSATGGLNLLLASTFGRGQFAIRLDPQLPPNSFVSGPRVTQLINPNPVGGPSSSFRVVFSGPVNPATFTTDDVRITGPNGLIPVQSVTVVAPPAGQLPTTFDIAFGPVADARTSVDVLIGANPAGGNVPRITDLGGFPMNQDNDLVNGEPVVDQYRTTILLNGTTNSRLVVVSSPATAVAGQPVSVTVEARDPNDQLITGLNGRLDLSAAPGTGPFSPAQVQLVNGRATFDVTFQRAGDQTVRVNLGGASGANPTAFTVRVTAAPASRFQITPPNTVLTSGAGGGSVAFTVTALDAFGNLADAYAGSATVTQAGAAATVPETLNLVNGVGTFTGQFTNTGTTTVTVTGPDPLNPLGSISGSASVSVNSGTAAGLVIAPRVPGPYVIGQPVTVDVRAVDAAGNTAAFNGPFTATVTDPSGTVAPANLAFVNGTATLTVTFGSAGTFAVNVNAGALTGTSGPLVVLSAPPRPSPTQLLTGLTGVGTGAGGSPVVQVVGPNAAGVTQLTPFPAGFNNEVDPNGPGFTGGIRVAVADVTGDGVPDYVLGTGPSITAFVQVVDGKTNRAVQNLQPFADFKGGVFVAAGDVTGDGVADIVVTPDVSGGPRVVVYRGGDLRQVASFFQFTDDPNFRGGARAAVGDMNNDGFAEVVVSAGFGGGPRTSIFDGAALAKGRFIKPVGDFFLFEETLRDGSYIAVGDVNGDGFGDIIGGGGPGGGPRVRVINGQTLLTEGVVAAFAPGAAIADFFAADAEQRGGVRVAAKNLDGDRFTDVVTGAGEKGGSGVTGFRGSSVATGGQDVVYAFDALDGFDGGVFVG